jgi:hypothetical protein
LPEFGTKIRSLEAISEHTREKEMKKLKKRMEVLERNDVDAGEDLCHTVLFLVEDVASLVAAKEGQVVEFQTTLRASSEAAQR